MITKPSDTVSRGQSDPMDVDAVNSLSSGKKKGSSSPRDGCFKCGGAHFQRECHAHKGNGKQSSGKGKQSGPRVRAKERVKKARNIQRFQGCQKLVQGKTSETGFSCPDKIRGKLTNSGICTDVSH